MLVSIPASAKKLSSSQKKFNSLTKKIESQKKILVEWKEAAPLYNKKFVQTYEPLEAVFNDQKSEFVKLLDKLYDLPLFKKTEKFKIKNIICGISEALISEFNKDDLKELFNKYSDDDYDTVKNESDADLIEQMKDMAKDMFDFDFDEDITCPEDFQAHLQEKLQEEKPKTKKQIEKEIRQDEEDKITSKSVQEVYRKLVTELHPDREPDEEERKRKTELMQRVNVAYGKKDLLALLELQLEIEQIDAAHLSQIADSRLIHFNKILREQLFELEQETAQIEEHFKYNLNIPHYARLMPNQLMMYLNDNIKELKSNISSIKSDINRFNNPLSLKAWLKNIQQNGRF